ncbi:MAG: hypothetical protein MUC57_14445 [Desulfobacterales bacterium]|nr:hypothetical protein [Desulfobacterales bacterium]
MITSHVKAVSACHRVGPRDAGDLKQNPAVISQIFNPYGAAFAQRSAAPSGARPHRGQHPGTLAAMALTRR